MTPEDNNTETDQQAAAGTERTPDALPAAERLTSDLDQVAEVQKLESLGLMAGGIAHDFNNILTGVLGSADLALSDLAPETPSRDHLLGIKSAARRAAELARELLAYSGKARFVVEPLDLSTLIDESKQLIRISLTRKPMIEFDLPTGLESVEADRTQVRQILLNLVTNSSEALEGSGGVIEVRTGNVDCDDRYLREVATNIELQPGRYVYFEVRDSGKGMDDETRRNLFRPFFSTKGQGRGLGLAAVLGIVSGHGGGIRIASAPGRGTTMRVLLPASTKDARQPVCRESKSPDWRGSGTVLVIDDEPTVKMVATSMLELMGLDVLSAADGKEGVETFRCFASEIDLVLVDRTMPRLSGIEAIHEVKKIEPHVPVVLMSGYSAEEMEERYGSMGITTFLEKPFDFETLRQTVRERLEARDPKPRHAEPVPDVEYAGLRRDLSTYRKLAGEIKLAHYDTAMQLTRAAEERSRKLIGRLERISRLAAELARELGVSDDAVQVLAAAAPFHDIGGVELPETVFDKNGPLSDEEWSLVKSHAERGGDLLTGLCSRVIEAGAEIALSHHERWDGSGYPFGLAGRDIPFFGRIVALVDQYDALRSPRPHKPALSHERSCEILLEGDERTRPEHFDPQVLRAFGRVKDQFEIIFDSHLSTLQGAAGDRDQPLAN